MSIEAKNITNRVLHLDASARQEGSVSRSLTVELLEALRQAQPGLAIVERDLNEGIPHIDDSWISANTTPEEKRTAEQKNRLVFSDELVQELSLADTLIINIPVYNFGIPSTLKAWLDHVCRAGITFNYTKQGPIGLLNNKRAIFVYASGGTKIGSEIDYASRYMRHVMGFIGIHDVEEVAADRLGADMDVAMNAARSAIDSAVKKAA